MDEDTGYYANISATLTNYINELALWFGEWLDGELAQEGRNSAWLRAYDAYTALNGGRA